MATNFQPCSPCLLKTFSSTIPATFLRLRARSWSFLVGPEAGAPNGPLRPCPKSGTMRGLQEPRGLGGAVSDGGAGQRHAMTLRDYLRVVRRRKWIIVQAVGLVRLVAVALSLRQREMYRASAEVLLATQKVANQLNGIPDQTISQDADRHAQTQADLARVPAVPRETLRRAGLQRPVDVFPSHSSATAKTTA